MSLFIGNVPNDMDPGEFEEIFTKIGSCQVRLKVQSHSPFNTYREHSVSSTSTRKSTLRRLSLTSMVTRLVAALFESAGARRAAEAATEAAVAARAASTVARMVTCRETAPSPGKAAVAGVAETASTAASLGTCPASARNPRSQESLVVVAVAVAEAADASIVGRTDTCRVNARSQGSPENQEGPAADLLAGTTAESVSLVA